MTITVPLITSCNKREQKLCHTDVLYCSLGLRWTNFAAVDVLSSDVGEYPPSTKCRDAGSVSVAHCSSRDDSLP